LSDLLKRGKGGSIPADKNQTARKRDTATKKEEKGVLMKVPRKKFLGSQSKRKRKGRKQRVAV